MVIAFENLFGRHYEGGANWLEVTLLGLGAIEQPPKCLLLDATAEVLPGSLRSSAHLQPVPLIHRQRSQAVTQGQRIWRKALRRPWEDQKLTAVAEEHGIDLWVGFSGFEGLGAHRPLLVWYPDFQWRHFPELFSSTEIRDRDRQWNYVADRADGIIVISQSVADDALSSHPQLSEKLHVLGFPPVLGEAVLKGDPEEVRRKYNLPERFLLVCNQFWQHKNHALVLRALSQLKRYGKVPPVVAFTGHPHDYRNPDAFSQLLRLMHEEGLNDYCRFLGVVPRTEQLALLRASEAVIQPSRFEGRGAIGEEATLLGVQLLCSDLPVHRELNVPGARFFPVDGVDELAGLMTTNYQRSTKSSADIVSESQVLAAEYGEGFMSLCGLTHRKWEERMPRLAKK
jgi:glycosyltransferase involved in cell wall biosynthesis